VRDGEVQADDDDYREKEEEKCANDQQGLLQQEQAVESVRQLKTKVLINQTSYLCSLSQVIIDSSGEFPAEGPVYAKPP